MPTENRSSNTDPRDVFIRLNPLGLGENELRKDSAGFEDQRTHSDYLLFLAGYRETHPDPQPHPEPIAWMVGTAFWWTKEEAERDAAATGLPIVGLGPMTGAAPAKQHQGEPVVLPPRREWNGLGNAADNLKAAGWNACLMAVEKLGPLYTHADPGEVERLRDGLRYESERAALCLEELQDCEAQRDEFYAEVTKLRSQLAERDVLLREADEFMYIMTGHDSHARLAHKYGEKWWDAIDKLRGKVCTALSSNSAPQVKS